MQEELKILSNLGVQKIYNDTHIPQQYVKALIAGTFGAFTKVQFLGFISILEREYNCSLANTKSAGREYFDALMTEDIDDGLLVMPAEKKIKTWIYGAIVLLVFIGALGINFAFQEESPHANVIDDTLIQDVQKSIIEAEINASLQEETKFDENTSVDNNTSIDENMTLVTEEESSVNEQTTPSVFAIVPRTKVWFGYIDVETNKKRQATLKDTMTLDANKSWLLLFGHGYIDMSIDGVQQKFDSRSKVRFLYENGVLKSISREEFKRLNRGRQW